MQIVKRSTFNLMDKTRHCSRLVAVSNGITSKEILKSWREIPGPSSLPLIGQLHHFLPGGKLHNKTEPLSNLLAKNYGPIVKLEGLFGSKPQIFLFDAEACSYVLRNENWLPVREGLESLDYYRKVYAKNNNQDTPHGLMTDHGESWKKFRSTVNPVMLQPKTIQLYKASLAEVAQDMIKRIKLLRNDKKAIKENFNFEMNLWALESIGVVALGGRLNCFDPNLPKESPVRKLIEVVNDIFKVTPELELKPSIWRYISTPAFKRVMKLYEDQVRLSKYFIEKAIDQLEAKDKTPDEEKGVLEKLLAIDKNIALIMVSDMLFAGVDTTSNMVINTLYLLAVNQEKQRKLRAEITSQTEKRPYVKACLKEAMRMMPITSGNKRQTSKEYNILGYKIPKDTQPRLHRSTSDTKTYFDIDQAVTAIIIFGHQYLSSLEEHFPRSKEYIPERWIVDKDDPLYHKNASHLVYSPFGFGVRMCIGKRIAELEMETFIAAAIENFEVEWSGPPLNTKQFSINYAISPYNFTFKDIN